MVVAANPLATAAGVAILARGGSAVDAAIAVQMVLNLVEPQSSGIGGGAFLLHYEAAKAQIVSFDGRETAPAGASPELFLQPDGRPLAFFNAVDSGLSVGTPGVLRALELAHQRHGRLAWAVLFEPAIALAERGFPVSPRLHALIAKEVTRIRAQSTAAAYFLSADGGARPAGTILRNPELATTLRQIASGGADAFYRGPIAAAIVAAVHASPTHPGKLSRADLAGYQAVARAPLCALYRVEYRVCGMGPPSSGGITTLQTLGMLERFDLARLAPNSVAAVHLVSEAYRLAYADRARYIADPAFVNVPVAGMLASDYLAGRAALIDPARSLGAPPAGVPSGAPLAGTDHSAPLPGTSHLVVVDRAGNAVSMTSSIEQAFGSLHMVGGFLLNNQLTDFSFAPVDQQGRPIANRVEPGKRPRSSMAPTIVLDSSGRLEAALGSPGGSNIIQYVTGTLIGLIDWRLNVAQALELPHFGAQTSATTVLERGTALAAIAPQLEGRGHRVAL
ncbi:MAG: gamma-glutamyltransferase, partial [Burkholderiaceae bacterium]|nr:gamma-glutamyltransferase [Burkholderiaceae bacterium]